MIFIRGVDNFEKQLSFLESGSYPFLLSGNAGSSDAGKCWESENSGSSYPFLEIGTCKWNSKRASSFLRWYIWLPFPVRLCWTPRFRSTLQAKILLKPADRAARITWWQKKRRISYAFFLTISVILLQADGTFSAAITSINNSIMLDI